MERDDLVATARWKWSGGRLRRLCKENSEDEVREISRVSFSARIRKASDRTRCLNSRGVNWPMASVILHFAFPDRYPILDVRVMRTVYDSPTVKGSPHYAFDKWLEYVELTTSTARQHGISMRTLDKALWRFDKAASADAIEPGWSRFAPKTAKQHSAQPFPYLGSYPDQPADRAGKSTCRLPGPQRATWRPNRLHANGKHRRTDERPRHDGSAETQLS